MQMAVYPGSKEDPEYGKDRWGTPEAELYESDAWACAGKCPADTKQDTTGYGAFVQNFVGYRAFLPDDGEDHEGNSDSTGKHEEQSQILEEKHPVYLSEIAKTDVRQHKSHDRTHRDVVEVQFQRFHLSSTSISHDVATAEPKKVAVAMRLAGRSVAQPISP